MSKSTPPNIANPLEGRFFLYLALVFSLAGAFLWAIRGTTGFGGAQGGILAGLGWALIWYCSSRRLGNERHRPYGHAHVISAILLGITCGGFTGYGVYISWVQGRFHLDYPDGMREISPWAGYLMLFVCGLHWGGLTGAFLAWCAPRKSPRLKGWVGRILSGAAGAVACYAVVVTFPHWFLPYYHEGIYADHENRTCLRAADCIRSISPHVGAWLGFLVFEVIRRDFRAVAVMSLLALGFALSFSIGGIWQVNYVREVPPLDWWKFWELSIGLGGGLTLAFIFFYFNRPDFDSPPRPVSTWEKSISGNVLICLGTATVLANGLDGWSRLHGVSINSAPVQIATLIVAGLLYVFSLRSQGAEIMPRWLPRAAVGSIILSGFAVSIPPELKLADGVLLSIYLVCIIGAVASYRAFTDRYSLQYHRKALH